ncbi:FtsK/SpoIIIE domain-containing protein [Umezawaea sp. Da 62-37]|uniref:FtsK/SpoIIIE domain-containing protein n=1 Tax=Umezawaea sp. Da 62-37 TaxID=3075927 RepID=UPI0028F6DD3E|nr:FtsK/SpoIIIE domain-containing protein [Umezawaea sp. Da 62-37]WNV90391.1 FtsK/SpoIIIE domain-containing protein [Umezawaea sp. Da 62-37]
MPTSAWPRSTLGDIVLELIGALRKVRLDHSSASEEVLASSWRSAMEAGSADLLGDPDSYLQMAFATRYFLDILRRLKTPRERLAEISDLARPDLLENGPVTTGVRFHLPNHLQNLGAPLPDDMAVHRAVFGVGRPIQEMLEQTGGGVLDDEGVERLATASLGAHALNAPDAVWTLLSEAAPAGDVGEQGVAEFTFPNLATIAVVETMSRTHAELVAAERRETELRSATTQIGSALANGEVDDWVLGRFEDVGIDTACMRDLLGYRRDYRAAGPFRKLVMGNPDDEIQGEAHDLLMEWNHQVQAAVERAEEVHAKRSAGLRRLRPRVEEHALHNVAADDPLRPQEDYIGSGLSDDVSPWGTLWFLDPVADASWARLPESNCFRASATLLTGGRGLTYEAAERAARAIVLDQMSRALPGRLRLTWIDPSGRGKSAGPLLGMLDGDKSMIDGAVHVESDDITAALRRVSDRMAKLEQQCLRDTHADLAAYNMVAGSLAEPNQIVVVTGYPNGFTEDNARRLHQIAENGKRLGIQVLVVTDPLMADTVHTSVRPNHHYPVLVSSPNGSLPHWWNPDLLPGQYRVLGHGGRPHATILGTGIVENAVPCVPCDLMDFDASAAERIVTGYLAASASAAEVRIDTATLQSADDGTANSADGVIVPLGIHGRGNLLELELGRGLRQNVLIGGLPGSGKSTLMHTLITSAVRRYSPDELELYLLDFKQGVEFRAYADLALPHAKVVAVQSEREFGLSVLRGLRAEIDRRGTLFRGKDGGGADNIRTYRQNTGKPLPRVVVVVDEFQVLFADDDAIAHECAQHLDHLVRQGRAFGVHAVLGTQTLRGHGAMNLLRGTLDQVAVRIVLKTNEADSRLFLADDNPAGAGLGRPGLAIYNEDAGHLSGNKEFQVAISDDARRTAVIAEERQRADESGFTRRPLVFDGTRIIGVADDDDVVALTSGRGPVDRKRIRLHLGLPVAIGGSGAIDLRRRAGSHLAVVDRDAERGIGALVVALKTGCLSTTPAPEVVVVDCLSEDEDHGEVLFDASAWLPQVTFVRRVKLAATVSRVANEVRRRVEEDDTRAPRLVLVISALNRARDLGDENTYAEEGTVRHDLLSVLKDGPDYGVHVVVNVDSVETLERRLGGGSFAEFGIRMIGQCSADTSQRVLGTAAASRLGDGYALVHEPDDNRLETVRPFPVPPLEWLSATSVAEQDRSMEWR